MWYLQFHLVCDRLESSLALLTIDLSSYILNFGCQPYSLYSEDFLC
ncbi:Uncharacterised protein [Aggregatibacter actinomycetemcomitans]|nr:Uncharacterised protein [Aggregatibacter actinomycetemcomitans]